MLHYIRNMRMALAQINPTIGDFPLNLQKIVQNIEKAKDQGAEVIVFPEMALSGYPPEDLLLLPDFVHQMEQALLSLLHKCQGITVILGLARAYAQGEKKLRNSAAVIDNGKILGFQDKILLPDYDVFSEKRYFDPGTEIKPWEIRGKKVAIMICEDIWGHAAILEYVSYTQDPVKMVVGQEVDLVINLSASPFFLGAPERRHRVCAHAARTLDVPILLVNQIGGNDSLIFDGHSFVMNSTGELYAEAKGFQEDLVIWNFNEKATKKRSYDPPMQSLLKALVLGTKDYFQKVGIEEAILGLSGGIDSALTAYIAVQALGKNKVHALFMPSGFTSEESREDAEEQASLLGISLEEISIEELFISYKELLHLPLLKDRKEDTTEENLQARIRGMILMAYSNKLGYMVLGTGNKSEMAVGYATLYGDMCGGLEILGDVTKCQVQSICHWLNREKVQIVPRIIEKPPSAELKASQKDSDTLPPYEQLDAIIDGYVHEHRSPQEIAELNGISLELVQEIVRKIHNNEYKRQQAPPALRVTKRSFSEGRRFPIAQHWNIK